MRTSIIICFLLIISGKSTSQEMVDPTLLYDAPDGLFETDSLRTIYLDFYDADYHEQLVDGWHQESGLRLPAKLTLSNGVVLDTVAVRYKGNSTFYIAEDQGNPKVPYNIDMNAWRPGQRLMNYPKLKLANGLFDPTFCREVSGYEIYRDYGPAPQANYIRLVVNGEYLGLYINTESVDRNFLTKHFSEDGGVFFKCDPSEQFGGGGDPGSSDLEYLGEDIEAYYPHYTPKSEDGWEALLALIKTMEFEPEKLGEVLNIDRVLWHFALNNCTLNLDTYNGLYQHNYYLYQTQDSLFQIIPWDLSETYLSVLMGHNFNTDALFEYDPYNGYGSSGLPLVRLLTEDPNSLYGKIYTAHMRTLLEEAMDAEVIKQRIADYQELIGQSVFDDDYKLFDNAMFYSVVNEDFIWPFVFTTAGILPTVDRRNEYLNSRPEFQYALPELNSPSVSDSEAGSLFTVASNNAASIEFMMSTNGFHSKFESKLMNDDGENGDEIAGDGVFSILLSDLKTTNIIDYYYRAHTDQAVQLLPKRAEYFYFQYRPNNGVVINEVMALNISTASDQDGEFNDWIELYNNSEENISLSEYSLTDDINELSKWVFPDTSISANSYLIVWADEDLEQDGLHANFRLEASGESLYLLGPSRQILDQMIIPPLDPDVSYGRYPNGKGPMDFLAPTFSAENQLLVHTSSQEPDPYCLIYPNPVSDRAYLSCDIPGKIKRVSLFDLMGALVYRQDLSLDSDPIQLEHLASGAYIFRVETDRGSVIERVIIR